MFEQCAIAASVLECYFSTVLQLLVVVLCVLAVVVLRQEMCLRV